MKEDKFSFEPCQVSNNLTIDLDGTDDWYLKFEGESYLLDKKKLYELFKGLLKT